MKKSVPVTPLQGGLFSFSQTPRKPLKTKGFPPHPSLTTPPHHDFVEVVRDGCGGCGSGVGVVCVSVEVWVRRGGGGLRVRKD